MIIIPAIDIKDGKVVRLFKGDFDQVTEYSADPLDMARHWRREGALMLHLVDLDGALSGVRKNEAIIKRITQDIGLPVQVGGGIRTLEGAVSLLEAGVNRIVLGTKVVEDRSFLVELLGEWRSRIAVSLDCSNGFVAQRGWVETSGIKGVEMAAELVAMGLKYIVYTDIARDGTMSGPNIDGLKEMLNAVNANIIVSGGIKSLDDIRALLALGSPKLWGAISGKAIYEGALDLNEAVKLCDPCSQKE